MKVRFAILPTASESRVIGKLAKQITKGFASRVIVDNIKRIPHLTLFVLDIKKKKLEKIEKQTERMIGKINSFKLYTEDCWTHPNGSIALGIKNSPKLRALQRRLSGNKKGFKYPPHFTLTILKMPVELDKVLKKAPKLRRIFHTDSVALCLSDRNSQVYKVIKKFKLK